MKAGILLTLCVCLASISVAQEVSENGFSVGFQYSDPSLVSFSFDQNILKTEGRLFVNKESRFAPDFEVMTGAYFFRAKSFKSYAGLGVMAEVDNFDPILSITIPIGLVVYPVENKRFGVVMEMAPVLQNATLNAYLRGNFGVRFSLSGEGLERNSVMRKVEKDTLDINFDRGYYLTLAAPSASVGIQYSWFKGNFDWHAGVTTFIPFGLYGGVYYHFIKKHSSSNLHLYTGIDAGVGYYITFGYEELLPVAYLPVGFQYITPKGFTVSLEAAGFLNPDGFISPWFGVKIGRTIMKK